MKDTITTCAKCGSPLCYEKHYDNIVVWNCLQCGFSTNSMLIHGSEAVSSYEEALPRLFIDIKHIDKNGIVWYPTTITKEGVGIIFPDGTSKEDWRWAVALHVPVEEHEKERFKKKDGTYHSFKTDMKNVLHFDKQYFSKALESLGFI